MVHRIWRKTAVPVLFFLCTNLEFVYTHFKNASGFSANTDIYIRRLCVLCEYDVLYSQIIAEPLLWKRRSWTLFPHNVRRISLAKMHFVSSYFLIALVSEQQLHLLCMICSLRKA